MDTPTPRYSRPYNWRNLNMLHRRAKTATADIGFIERTLFLAGILTSLLIFALLTTPAHAEAFTLGSVKQQVLRDYKNVAHLETSELQSMMDKKEDVLIFDVRETSEFDVSHIPGAIRVPPSSWGWQFLRKYGDGVKGKKVVFYCSVGVRSSIMAQRVREGLEERGAKKIYNLNGGVFAWHNERRSLINAGGTTPYVHPYDKHWGSLVDRQNETRMSPTQ